MELLEKLAVARAEAKAAGVNKVTLDLSTVAEIAAILVGVELEPELVVEPGTPNIVVSSAPEPTPEPQPLEAVTEAAPVATAPWPGVTNEPAQE